MQIQLNEKLLNSKYKGQNRSDLGLTTKGYNRPGFLCWMNYVLLFKSEEKSNAGTSL